jgi:hypothetical protein
MSTGDLVMPFYSTATQDKGALGRIHSLDAAATGFVYLNSGGTWRTSSAPISQIDLFPGAGNFVENSRFVLRGIL